MSDYPRPETTEITDETVFRCPVCKSTGDFQISISKIATITAEAEVIDDDSDTEWDSDSWMRCRNCGHQATEGDFNLEDQEG